MTSRLRLLSASCAGTLVVAGLAVASAVAPAYADTRSETFTASGTYTVPAGITSVHVTAVGAAGGRGLMNAAGGRGAIVETDLEVQPGDVLHVFVGSEGAAAAYPAGGHGGANGGGNSGTFSSGGGGGATDVRSGGDGLADRVVVAGGGGGAAFTGAGPFSGGDAGAAGEALTECGAGSEARPGGQSAGGAGGQGWGSCGYWGAGAAGTFGVGGQGGSGSGNGGGGGGGGWYGGGGGHQYGGGAGGSSYVDPTRGSATTVGLASTGPQVVISYARVAQPISFAGLPETAVAGTSRAVDVRGGGSGLPITLTLGNATTPGACSLEGATVTLLHPGTCALTASQAGDDSYLPGSATRLVEVGRADTTTTLQTSATALRATVAVSEPSALRPEGTVQFQLGDQIVGEAPVVDGVATFAQPASDNDAATVTAAFLGTDDLTGSSDEVDRGEQVVSFADATPATAVAGTTSTLTIAGGVSGLPVVASTGPATTAEACTVSGTTVTFAHAGTCQVVAAQGGDWLVRPGAAAATIEVRATETETKVSVQPTTITAAVTAVSPSTLVPRGQVRFSVDGVAVGTADLVAGRAVLKAVVPTGATRAVTAEYLGTGDADGSSGSTTRSDPRISATVSSPRAPQSGWYRTPVTVSFSCQEAGAALVACPPARVITRNGARQSVTGSVAARDGGSATVTVAGLSIDTAGPVVKVAGVKNKATYSGKRKPRPVCRASDALSGLVGCTLTQSVVRHSGTRVVLRYVAVARDRAGNQTRVAGTYTLDSKKRTRR